MKFFKVAVSVISAGVMFASAQAGAGDIPYQVVPCTTDSFQITSAYPSGNPSGLVDYSSNPISATSCYGVMSENDDKVKDLNPHLNLGYLGDGLLNGGITQDAIQYVSPTQFFTTPKDQLLALRDPNVAEDPGWIELGMLDGDTWKFDYSDVPVKIEDLITFIFKKDGTWSLAVNPSIKTLLSNVNGLNRSNFDHLAFAVKAGNQNSDAGWAIYDFNFNAITGFDLSIPYTFEGMWNMDDFDGKTISHMSLWARDPITDNNVPLPGTLFLMGIGLLALGFFMKRS